MLVTNARVFLGTGEEDFASSFQVVGGRISWVGELQDAPEDDDVFDFGGATVLPGFLDIHAHPALLGQLAGSTDLLPPHVGSIDALVAALRTNPELGRGRDRWVRGFGFDESRYPEGRWPNRHDLDLVSHTQPVFAQRCDVHAAVCNSFALKMAGITRHTPDPPGGAFGRDASGEPDGRLIEPSAWQQVLAYMPDVDDNERIANLAGLSAHYTRLGLVGVADLASSFTANPLESFRRAAAISKLPKLSLYPMWGDLLQNPPTLSDADRGGSVRIAGVKLMVDGAVSSATAWCHDPYQGGDSHGVQTASADDLLAAAAWARANGVQIACHAMGDAAIDLVLDLFAAQEGWLGEVPSVRIEHATLFSPERIARVRDARMPIAVVSHTIFFYAEYGAYEHNLSDAQRAISYPIRSFYEQLPHTALASDTPATAWSDADDPFTSIQAAVTRKAWNGASLAPEQAISVAQAILLYTARAASCVGWDDLGSITPGKEASFVVLDRDVFTAAPDELSAVRVAETWVAGERVHPRAATRQYLPRD